MSAADGMLTSRALDLLVERYRADLHRTEPTGDGPEVNLHPLAVQCPLCGNVPGRACRPKPPRQGLLTHIERIRAFVRIPLAKRTQLIASRAWLCGDDPRKREAERKRRFAEEARERAERFALARIYEDRLGNVPLGVLNRWAQIQKRDIELAAERRSAIRKRFVLARQLAPNLRSIDRREADEMFYALLDAAPEHRHRPVRLALTTLERDRLAVHCRIATHVIGGHELDAYYRVRWIGGASRWLFGQPPPGRGRYIALCNRGGGHSLGVVWPKEAGSLDPSRRVVLAPVQDDPPTIFEWGDSDTAPPLYPCATRSEIGRRNLNARPNWTLNRSLAGVSYALRLRDAADERSEARARYYMGPGIVGSLAGARGAR